MSKKVKILDDNKQEVEVDINTFYKHLEEYHSRGESLHEERGHCFKVDDKFRKKIKQLLDSNS